MRKQRRQKKGFLHAEELAGKLSSYWKEVCIKFFQLTLLRKLLVNKRKLKVPGNIKTHIKCLKFPLHNKACFSKSFFNWEESSYNFLKTKYENWKFLITRNCESFLGKTFFELWANLVHPST